MVLTTITPEFLSYEVISPLNLFAEFATETINVICPIEYANPVATVKVLVTPFDDGIDMLVEEVVEYKSPDNPVGPVTELAAPVGPVPNGPVYPVGPVTELAAPVDPVGPVTELGAPVEPVEPVGPVTELAAPVDPVDPVEPVFPVKPAFIKAKITSVLFEKETVDVDKVTGTVTNPLFIVIADETIHL